MAILKKANTVITLISLLAILAAVNFLASRHPLRADLTQMRVFTLSDSTKKILAGLGDVVTIRAYFTKDMPPALMDLRRDVEDILSEFKGAAGSRLKVEFLDPGASFVEEEQAASIGVPPVQMNVIDKDRAEVAKVFLGIGVFFEGRHEAIPVVQRIDDLEYDLAEAILKVSSNKLPKNAWLSQNGDDSPGAGFEMILANLARRYEVVRMTGKTLLDLDAKDHRALCLVSPRELSNDELSAVDRYLMEGGRIVALIDRFGVADGLRLYPVESDAVDLFARYGARVEDSLVLDGQNAMAAFSGGAVTYHMPYPFWPEVRRDQMEPSSHVVAGLESIVLPWTSPLSVGGGEAPSAVLARSTRFSTAVPGKDAKLDPQSATASLASGERRPQDLVVELSGPFGSYFASGGENPPKGASAIKESPASARIFLVGSSHWLADRSLSTFPQNAALFDNALDSLAMGDALIGIRSRERANRPIAALEDGARSLFKAINIAAGPLLLLAVGAAVFLLRRRARRSAQSMYG